MQRVFTAGTLVEAYLIQQLLESKSIRTRVLQENAQGAAGELPITEVWPEVWIEDAGLTQAALSIIRGYESATSYDYNSLCPCCGEENPKNFELCWACRNTLENSVS